MIQKIIVNINTLKTITNEQWRNRLETDNEGVLLRLADDNSYLDALSSLASNIKSSLLVSYGLENLRDVILPLQNNVKEDIKVLLLLKEFISKLNRDITLEFLKAELIQQGFWNNVEIVGQANKLILAVLLLEDLNLERLHLCLLVSRYERYAYQDFQLFMELDGIQDPLRQAEYREIQQRGVDNIQIDEDLVNALLDRYERVNTTNLESQCLKVLEYNNEKVVFILRESQRGGLRTFQEYIVGWNADLIVLRFGPRMKKLKVRAKEVVKEELYVTIASNIAKSNNPQLPINFIKSSLSNTRECIDNLLRQLLANLIPGIELSEISLENTPFTGRPNIIIQRNSENILLSQSLNDPERGFTLSSIIIDSKVSRVKVIYTTNRRQKHIFIFKIVESNNQYYIFLSGQGGGLRKRSGLIQLIYDRSGARILEAKEQ